MTTTLTRPASTPTAWCDGCENQTRTANGACERCGTLRTASTPKRVDQTPNLDTEASAPFALTGGSDIVPTNGRRDWVARITGPDPRYRVAREFMPKRKHRVTRGGHTSEVWGAKITDPGIYQWETREYGNPTPRKGIEVWTGREWRPLDGSLPELARRVDKRTLQTIIDHAPNRDADACTVCDLELAHFTPDGWPACDDHVSVLAPPTITPLPDEPVPF